MRISEISLAAAPRGSAGDPWSDAASRPVNAPRRDLARELSIGEWRMRPSEGRLVRDGEETRLRPRAMEVLELLAARPGRVVSKDEIVAGVWNGDAVEDGAIAHCISEIRGALGDTPRSPRYIETIPKRGYRLVALVAAADRDRSAGAAPAPGERRRRLRGLEAAGLVAGLAAAGLLGWRLRAERERRPARRLSILGGGRHRR